MSDQQPESTDRTPDAAMQQQILQHLTASASSAPQQLNADKNENINEMQAATNPYSGTTHAHTVGHAHHMQTCTHTPHAHARTPTRTPTPSRAHAAMADESGKLTKKVYCPKCSCLIMRPKMGALTQKEVCE